MSPVSEVVASPVLDAANEMRWGGQEEAEDEQQEEEALSFSGVARGRGAIGGFPILAAHPGFVIRPRLFSARRYARCACSSGRLAHCADLA